MIGGGLEFACMLKEEKVLAVNHYQTLAVLSAFSRCTFKALAICGKDSSNISLQLYILHNYQPSVLYPAESKLDRKRPTFLYDLFNNSIILKWCSKLAIER